MDFTFALVAAPDLGHPEQSVRHGEDAVTLVIEQRKQPQAQVRKQQYICPVTPQTPGHHVDWWLPLLWIDGYLPVQDICHVK